MNKVGVVGSGQIGPDIALHLAQTLRRRGCRVVVVDISEEALARGRQRCAEKLGKVVERGTLTPENRALTEAALEFTTDYGALAGAGLVIEAATEDLGVKRRIFAELERWGPPALVLASNSSHLEPDEIFTGLERGERALVIHYFFPAERNPLVEIVPAQRTDPGLTGAVMALYEEIGKVPIRVGGRYGYAVNPVFEGLFLAAALAVEAGLGTVREVDAAARRALGLGVGPFTAMNLTGGNPITAHALDVMTGKLGPWFRTPGLLQEAMQSGQPWSVAGRDDPVELPMEREEPIGDAMRGAYFGLVGQVLDSGIVGMADLELAVELGLAMRPPFAFMNDLGLDRALALVQAYASAHPGFVVPACLQEQARLGAPFRIDHVLRRDEGEIAVLTIRRPRVLNALSEEVYEQLYRHFSALRDDGSVAGVVLTGFGTRAFVAGADVNFLAGLDSPAAGFAASQRSKEVGNLIERLGKPVIAALNGLALGGGCELALCCTARLARKGLTPALGTPEANLGIIPGAGATQRLPRLVGIEPAAEILRTGRPLSGAEAVACGLIREEVEGDVVAAAVRLARAAARGEVRLTPIDPRPLPIPDRLPPVELGHLSRAIDRLMCRAIVEGCSRPLAEGLRFESEVFGACCATEDMKIGIRTFLTGGPRARAEFVHF